MSETPTTHEQSQPNLELQPSPSISVLQERIERLETEGAAQLTVYEGGNRDLPGWFYEEGYIQSKRELEADSKDGKVGPEDVTEYFDLFKREQKFKAEQGLHLRETLLHDFIYVMGESSVGAAIAAEGPEGPLKSAMLEYLKECNTKQGGSHIAEELHTLRSAYGFDSITDLLSLEGDTFADGVKKELFNPNSLHRLASLEARGDGDVTYEKRKEKYKKWTEKVISSATGITEEEASEYTFTAVKREELISVTKVIEAVNHFGIDRLKTIAKETNIHGLECYSIPQLEFMEKFANDPEALASDLQNRDVNVLMVNRVGDDNGVMVDSAEVFDDDQERTLFFEINTLDDIYRNMAKLNRYGIKPSSLILSSHSSAGEFAVADLRDSSAKRTDIASVAARKFIEQANDSDDLPPGLRGYSMHGMKGMARLVGDYMQPSRGLDDDKKDAGRKKIVFQACYLGLETEVKDVDEGGEKIIIGSDSVISRLGKDLLDSGLSDGVDIYGANTGIQIHKTENGARYSGPWEGSDLERPDVKAVRIRLEDGRIVKGRVKEIGMHKKK